MERHVDLVIEGTLRTSKRMRKKKRLDNMETYMVWRNPSVASSNGERPVTSSMLDVILRPEDSKAKCIDAPTIRTMTNISKWLKHDNVYNILIERISRDIHPPLRPNPCLKIKKPLLTRTGV